MFTNEWFIFAIDIALVAILVYVNRKFYKGDYAQYVHALKDLEIHPGDPYYTAVAKENKPKSALVVFNKTMSLMIVVLLIYFAYLVNMQ